VKPAQAGETVIDVSSSAGFKVGMDIVIDPDTPMMESNTIRAFGTIDLSKPLLYSHEAGAKVVQSANNTFPQSTGENDENGSGNAAQAMIAVASGAATLAVLSLSLFAVRWYRRSLRKQKEAEAEDNIDEFVGKLEEIGRSLGTGTWAQGTVRMNDVKPQEVDDISIEMTV